jgi:uncharacterized protein HemX
MPAYEDASGDSKAHQQPHPHPCRHLSKETKMTKAARYIEAACAVLLVLITGTYTYYASQQACAAITAANAAQSAAVTANESLKLTRQITDLRKRLLLSGKFSLSPYTLK